MTFASEDQTSPVAAVDYPDLGPGAVPGERAGVELLADVELSVTVELGRVRLRVRDLLQLREGSVLELDRLAGAPVDVLVNGRVVARAEVVVIDDELGARITELLRHP